MQLHHFFEQSCTTYPDNIALVCDNAFITYQELEQRANQLAHYLAQNKIKKGSIVAILLERSIHSYIAILATLKLGAAYVPIEPDYPEERVSYIFSDLPPDLVITSSQQRKEKELCWPSHIVIDELSSTLATLPSTRLSDECYQADEDSLCYVIYTSGSTGKPKGVEITHKNIGHYVRSASQVYGITASDRVYQGFSLAFDASLEEVWMAFAHGAALIACTQKEVRSGLGLISFLQQHQVSVFSTVPTLLSTLEGHLPHLRLLILGGEMCSANLVKKWMRPDLRIMNTYGPTEASVVTTYFECHPDKEVTIGRPLPGYEAFILDENNQDVAAGDLGELCIGGPAVARGYVNKPEMTDLKFMMHKGQRLYRTGDLVLQTANGELQFAGRVDDQIKLRGFRIELNEIEAVILEYPGLKQAVVSLQTLEQPTLVAYLLAEQKEGFDLNGLKAFLRSRLPDYMMPALFEFLEAFPLLSSGKVNRKELPLPTHKVESKAYKAPETDLEQEIATVWERVLNCGPVSVDADFFYDLGGHSLWAAQVISQLRKIPSLSTISILDLYKKPTVQQLAEKFKHYSKHAQGAEANERREKYRAPHWKYVLCGIGQFFGCVLQYALGAWQLLAVILCYAWITSKYSLVSTESQVAFLALFLSMPFISMAITVSLKWLLVGRIKPGIYPLWGWFYYRWWLVQRLQKSMYLGKYLAGSPLVSLYFRLLGAKIGNNCHIRTTQICTPDLIRIGDNVSLGMESRLNGYIIEDGWLKIGTIVIGDDCFVGSRTVLGINSCMKDSAVLEDMSMLPDGRVLETGSYNVGSPAFVSTAPKNHPTKSSEKAEPATLLERSVFGILHYLGIVFMMLMYYLCFLPSISLISYVYDHSSLWLTVLAIPVGATLFLMFYYICLIVCKKIIMDKIKPGSYPVLSFYYLRQWIIEKMCDVDEISILADSLYSPMLLRCLGAKLGKGVELGETPHLIPDLLTIEEGGFIASSVALAWPSVYQGIINFEPVRIGKRGFAGNSSILPGGKTIGDRSLLGLLSIPPENNESARADTTWLGSPAVFLPKREIFTGFSEEQTYNPPRKLYYLRLAIEFCRIIIPTTFSFVSLFSLLNILDFMLSNYSWQMTAFVLPFAEFLITVALVSVLVGLKWLLVGKLKPLVKPIWDVFIWKNDIVEYSYNYYINPRYTNKVIGTPFALWLHRCLGTKVGKRVFTDSVEFSEFDLISLGNDVCINADGTLQTHLYEDRIFKVSHVSIGNGANIGVAATVLYNTLMEENSSLGNLSLLMKGECLPENTCWAGIPAQTTLAIQPGLAEVELVEEEELATA